MLHLCRTQK